MPKRTYDQILEEELQSFKATEKADILIGFEKAGLSVKEQAKYLKAVKVQNKVIDKMMKDYHAKGGALQRPPHIPVKIQYVQSSKEKYEGYYKKASKMKSKRDVIIYRGATTKERLISACRTAFGEDVSNDVASRLSGIDDDVIGGFPTDEIDDLFDFLESYETTNPESYSTALQELEEMLSSLEEMQEEKESEEESEE